MRSSGEAATAVQSLERLLGSMKETVGTGGDRDRLEAQANAEALDSLRSAVVQARESKQRLEELSCGLTRELNAERSQYSAPEMAELKKKVKSVRASRMTEEERNAIAEELREREENSGREILFAILETNPWYDAVYDERMASSRRNTLFYAFRRHNHLLLSHRGDKSSNVEAVSVETQGSEDSWLEGREMRWLVQQMVGGSNYRVLTAILASLAHVKGQSISGSAVVLVSDAWKDMLKDVAKEDGNERLVTQRLLSVTLAQAANSVSDRDKRVKVDKKAARKAQMEKKNKQQQEQVDSSSTFTIPPHLRLKAAAREDVFLLCQAWSLMVTVERQLASSTWDASPPREGEGLPSTYQEAMERIQRLKTSVQPALEDELFIELRREACRLEAAVEKAAMEKTLAKELGPELEAWMGRARGNHVLEELERALSFRSDLTFDQKQEEGVTPCHIICDTDEKLQELLKEIGPPLTVQKGSLIYLAEGGSRMYNLSTPESDSDFVGVFLWDTSLVLSGITKKKESAENKGKQARVEHSCFEARMMADMLLKGNPNVIELLFAPSAHYCSKEFEFLRQNRRKLISEYAMVQYDSWVKWHLARIEGGSKAERAGKLFYHALHKLAGLQCLARGEDPIVVMEDGSSPIADEDIPSAIASGTITRDIILRIRKGPLEGPLSVEALLKATSARHSAVRAQIKARDWRYPEWGDQGLLTHWLLLMRLRSFQTGAGPSAALTWHFED